MYLISRGNSKYDQVFPARKLPSVSELKSQRPQNDCQDDFEFSVNFKSYYSQENSSSFFKGLRALTNQLEH